MPIGFRYSNSDDVLAHAAPPRSSSSVLDDVQLALSLDAPSPELAETLSAARRRAGALAASVGGGHAEAARRLAAVTFAAEAIAATWLDRDWSRARVDALVHDLAELVDAAPEELRAELFTRAVRERHVLQLPPHLGAGAVLQMLCAFTDAAAASFWSLTPEGAVVPDARTGDDGSSRRARDVAREAVANGREVTSGRSLLHAFPVERWGRPAAALVLRCASEGRGRALAYAAEAAVALAPIVEFDTLLARNASREESLTAVGERRLARFGFDLHDGPMQDIAALAADVRLFKQQLQGLLEGHAHAATALGRIDDLEARLVGLDRELRELATSLQSPAGLRVPLVDAVRSEVESYERKSGRSARFETGGRFDALTSSQKIALVRVVQEALSNVHEHSGASSVVVRVTATRARLGVEVTDDGAGFDVEQQLLAAARAGRLGLVGMGERIRLLGGRFDIESSPGGPTRVRASIPRWQPSARQV